ncbi:agrin-like [Dreissena polymorpha]|uniref:Kazal-like domain-containing protein n=1 Tax=Dreissena polymorpha TaxID=45954 RepID=A0A9D4FZV6_DREPO|nr:agrin-like [Dreissena polymorpha]KAH3805980.1 hypothetical protein DPMN_134290 [Dreissena polymorpha]
MRFMACILVFVVALPGLLAQIVPTDGPFIACQFINSFENCDMFITDSYCGSDGVTYANRCEFSKAHCQELSIQLLHIGDCSRLVDIATAAPVAGKDVVFDFFCTSLSHMTCPPDPTKVCGSNNRTYLNYCEFEKAKCTHRELMVKTYGECTA